MRAGTTRVVRLWQLLELVPPLDVSSLMRASTNLKVTPASPPLDRSRHDLSRHVSLTVSPLCRQPRLLCAWPVVSCVVCRPQVRYSPAINPLKNFSGWIVLELVELRTEDEVSPLCPVGADLPLCS